MIDNPIKGDEIIKVIKNIHIGDTVKHNTGGNDFEELTVVGKYPNFLRAKSSSGQYIALRWDDVVIRYRKGWIQKGR